MNDDSAPARPGESAREPSLTLTDDDAHAIASPGEVSAFQSRLFRLLERHTAIYTMGDSTSVPGHVAVDLLRSVCFVLGIDPERPEVPRRLLVADLEAEFRRGLAEIERKVESCGALWQEVCAAIPPIPNTALRDTLASIGDFPGGYDFRSMAHEITCDIDYPLCHPVPEDLLGVDYVSEYLHRLLVECRFLDCFEPAVCVAVLERTTPDHVDLLVNLYEPVATNAVGRAIIGLDPLPLRISEEERVDIARSLRPLSPAERSATMLEAASRTCDALGVGDAEAREYLFALVPELLPRIEAGLASGVLWGVFV